MKCSGLYRSEGGGGRSDKDRYQGGRPDKDNINLIPSHAQIIITRGHESEKRCDVI